MIVISNLVETGATGVTTADTFASILGTNSISLNLAQCDLSTVLSTRRPKLGTSLDQTVTQKENFPTHPRVIDLAGVDGDRSHACNIFLESHVGDIINKASACTPVAGVIFHQIRFVENRLVVVALSCRKVDAKLNTLP